MLRRRYFYSFLLVMLTFSNACTKVMVYASDHATETLSRRYPGEPSYVFAKCATALEGMGYELTTRDEYQLQIVTGWQPVTSESHYLEMFKRRDYSGTAGAYYQIHLNVVSDGVFARVDVNTVVKSISGKLATAKRVEGAFLSRLDGVLRSPQIQITNVGVENR